MSLDTSVDTVPGDDGDVQAVRGVDVAHLEAIRMLFHLGVDPDPDEDESREGESQEDELAEREESIHFLHRESKEGLGPAYIATPEVADEAHVDPGAATGEDTLVHALLAHCAGSLSGIGGVALTSNRSNGAQAPCRSKQHPTCRSILRHSAPTMTMAMISSRPPAVRLKPPRRPTRQTSPLQPPALRQSAASRSAS